ncbi:hypothetical protein, partial [Riemerella anatipestifer]|uniref:hypothetical protein n=1 Tax=Riemerella anatipestifer TaxID=34085 RepID=UPI001629F059
SPPAPMVLRKWESRSPPVFIFEKPLAVMLEAFFVWSVQEGGVLSYQTPPRRSLRQRSVVW